MGRSYKLATDEGGSTIREVCIHVAWKFRKNNLKRSRREKESERERQRKR